MQGTIDAAVPTLAAATGIMSFKFFWLRHDFFLYSADEKKKKTMNTTVVLKFGGTSVMAPEAIQRIVLTAAESHQVVLVVSALAGITNALTLGKTMSETVAGGLAGPPWYLRERGRPSHGASPESHDCAYLEP